VRPPGRRRIMERFDDVLLGRRCKARRTERDLSLRLAAYEAGVSMSTLFRLELGRSHRPELETVERLAAWLGLPLSELIVLRPSRRRRRVV
jgi:transcriptional regulator with XRE-family HTH domain